MDTFSMQYIVDLRPRAMVTTGNVVSNSVCLRFNTSDHEKPTLMFTKPMPRGSVVGFLDSKMKIGAIKNRGYTVARMAGHYISYKMTHAETDIFSWALRGDDEHDWNCNLKPMRYPLRLALVTTKDVDAGDTVIIGH